MLAKVFIVLIAAFIPPLIYTIWIRNIEKYKPEPWSAILVCFIWGATIAIIASLILEIILSIPITLSFKNYSITSLIMAVIIAPFVEELVKPMGLGITHVRKQIDELEDGLVYGAATGLGFSATENMFYSTSYISEGMAIFFLLVIIRTIGACLLHASATALTGYGFGKVLIEKKIPFAVIPYLMLAICAHAGYNFVLSVGVFGAFGSIILAISLSLFLIRYIKNKIIKLDRTNTP